MFVRLISIAVISFIPLTLHAQSAADGRWNFSMTSPFGEISAIVTLASQGDVLTGQFDLGGGRIWPVNQGLVKDNTITFNVIRDGASFTYQMTATIDGDKVIGQAAAMGTTAPWAMTRVQP